MIYLISHLSKEIRLLVALVLDFFLLVGNSFAVLVFNNKGERVGLTKIIMLVDSKLKHISIHSWLIWCLEIYIC